MDLMHDFTRMMTDDETKAIFPRTPLSILAAYFYGGGVYSP